MSVPKTIEEVVAQLRRDPAHPVRANLGGLAVEVRAVPELQGAASAAEVLAEVERAKAAWLEAARAAGKRIPAPSYRAPAHSASSR